MRVRGCVRVRGRVCVRVRGRVHVQVRCFRRTASCQSRQWVLKAWACAGGPFALRERRHGCP